jgi:hypothetical protein
MNRWRVGEDRGSKETDGCPLTESGGSVAHNVLHAGIFLLDADMTSVLPFRSLVTIQSTWVPTRSVLLPVTSLPTCISCLICLHSGIHN